MVTVSGMLRPTALRIEAGDSSDTPGQVVAIGVAGGGLLVEPRPLGIQHRPLEFAEAIVAADGEMLVPGAADPPTAVVDRAQPLGQIVVVRKHDAPFAATEVLARLEGEHAHLSDRAHAAALVFGPVGVGGVFDEHEIVPLGNRQQGIHVDRLTAEMDWNDGLGPRSHQRLRRTPDQC